MFLKPTCQSYQILGSPSARRQEVAPEPRRNNSGSSGALYGRRRLILLRDRSPGSNKSAFLANFFPLRAAGSLYPPRPMETSAAGLCRPAPRPTYLRCFSARGKFRRRLPRELPATRPERVPPFIELSIHFVPRPRVNPAPSRSLTMHAGAAGVFTAHVRREVSRATDVTRNS